jgi:hypothetical protein
MRKGIESCRSEIEESADDRRFDGGFFAREPEVREMMLSTRDAAVRLLAEMPVTEAVA